MQGKRAQPDRHRPGAAVFDTDCALTEIADTIVVIGSTAWTHNDTGKQAESPKVDVWRFNREGKAIAFFEYYDTANIIQAATPT